MSYSSSSLAPSFGADNLMFVQRPRPLTGHWSRGRLGPAQDPLGPEDACALQPLPEAPPGLLDPAVTTAVLDRLRKGKHLMRDEKLARLSPQEERILTHIADGRTNKEIGDELTLAEKTVKNYVSSILSKLEVARRAEAAAYLARHTTMPGSVE
jgi:DNA-binding CsgD family transcriptional regulator